MTADPGAGYRAHRDAIDSAVARVLASGWYVLGKEGESFEAEFSAYQECGHTIGVANGTDAIELALQALGVGPGYRVATVANTVTATVAAICATGATPVFVEIDDATMVMDVSALEDVLLTGSIDAIVPVHLYGQPVDMPAVMRLATEHGCKVVEDCAQAHGATIGGRRVGTWGHAAAFSFYPTKNLGALGDGGAVFTRDTALAEEVRARRQYGWKQRYDAVGPGRNSRLDEIQAAILRARLPFLESENRVRRDWAARYDAALADFEWRLPAKVAGTVSAYHQFTVRSPRRDAWAARLREHGILAGILYPVPVHRQAAHRVVDLSLPVTERACSEVLCLPVHPQLSGAEIDRVIAVLKKGLSP